MKEFDIQSSDLKVVVTWISSGNKLIFNYTSAFIDSETIFINCTGSETMFGSKSENLKITFDRS